jgi:carboxypeptidase family protein/TonB-dependent receptor-like protein
LSRLKWGGSFIISREGQIVKTQMWLSRGVVKTGFVGLLLFVMAVLLLTAIPVVAQLPTASVLGNVKDSSGASVPNATVTARNTDTNFTRTVKTEEDGSYRLSELAVGRYEVKAERTGFRTELRTGLTLEVTQTAVINFTLEVGATVQEVVVTGEAPIVNTQDSTLGGTVNEQKIAELPLNGRNYIDLALLQPGVSQDKNQTNAAGTSFSVNGAPPRSNNFTLDGAILQNSTGRSPVAGDSGDALGVDGIKEYKIVTGTFQAEYGLAMGSQMVAVSKGGTNQFHGDVFEYLRNSALDANDFFQNQAGSPIAPLRKNQFGAAFGGPIKKDKTFFYAVYEGIRLNLGVPINNTVPAAGCHPFGDPALATAANNYGAGTLITLANCPDLLGLNDSNGNQLQSVTLSPYTAPFLAIVPLPNLAAPPGGVPSQIGSDHDRTGENYGQMRVDQNFSANDTFFARYTIDNALLNQTQADYTYFRNLATARNQWITLSENHIFSPTVLNTARFSFSRTHDATTLNNTGLAQNNGLGPELVPGFSTGVVDLAGSGGGVYQEFGSVNAAPTTFSVQNIYTLSEDVNWTRGKHAFKFGTLLNRYNRGAQDTNSFNGQLQYNQLSDFLQAIPTIVEFAPTFANENRFFIYHTYGFYGQDDWRVTQRLTVNLGLRYEFMNTPHELQGKQSRLIDDHSGLFSQGPIIKNNTLHDLSPRVGLAYDLFGNGKTAIRGGAGIYYDIGNIGSVLGGTTNGALPYGALVDINIPCTSQFFKTNNINNPLGSPGFMPCNIADWENTLATQNPALYPLANGFPLPIPDQVRNFYKPTCERGSGAGAFALCVATPGVVTPTFMDYNFKSPYMIQYNASIQQQLPWNMALSVAYVGNHGVHLATIRDGNPILPTSLGPCGDPASVCVNGSVPFWDTGAPNYQNINPNYGSDLNIGTFASSRYNSLQVVLQKRVTKGLQFEMAYTRSRVTDETQGQANIQDCQVSGGLLGVYPLNPQIDKGPACFNITNNWEINMLYHFPNLMKGNRFAAKMLNGWFMSSIVSIQSGQPFSAFLDANRSNSGVAQAQQGERVNINTPALLAAYPCTSQPGQPAAGNNPCAYTPIVYDPKTVLTGDPNKWFNPAMFSMAPNCTGPGLTNCSDTVGQLGTAARNILTGPPERNWDFSLVKGTKLGFLGEAGMLEFRAEFFNVLNHPNFSGRGLHASIFDGAPGDHTPFSEAPHGSAGRVTRQLANNQRQIQLALRVEF